MTTLKRYYKLYRDPTLLYPNNRPINSFLNNFINKDKKSGRNIYKMVHPSDTESFKEGIGKWDSEINVAISYEEMAEAFVCNHKYNQNTYSRYIQYKVYRHRIFTRDKLLKMKIIDIDSCLKCQVPDKIEHLFIKCEYSEILWPEVQKWIDSIGFSNYR